MKVRFVVGLVLFMSACTLEDPKEGVSVDQIIAWAGGTEAELELIANGQSSDSVVAILKQTDANQEVIFSTDQGYFAGQKNADNPKEIKIRASGKKAKVYLVADLLPNEEVTVTAAVGNFRIERKVKFLPATPAKILGETDRSVIQANQSDFATISLKLFRAEGDGYVSDRIRVLLTSEPAGHLEMPTFLETKDQAGTFKVRSKSNYTGPVQVTAKVGDVKEEINLTIE